MGQEEENWNQPPKQGPALDNEKKKEKWAGPQNGGQHSTMKTITSWPPFWGPALDNKKKKEKQAGPQNRGQHLSTKTKKKTWTGPQKGASTCWAKEKRKRNPQMGAVLVKQKKEKEKMNDWPQKGGPALIEQKKKKRNPQNGGGAHRANERKTKTND